MDEQIRIILIIIVSVSIFGLLVFVFVKNYIRNIPITNSIHFLIDPYGSLWIPQGANIGCVIGFVIGFVIEFVDRI